MTKQEFEKMVQQGVVILDGATGSNLMKAGMPKGVCTEAWILEHPEVLIALQKAYAQAGSQIVYAPTFSANAMSLRGYQLDGKVSEINQELVAISRAAVGTHCLIAGDLTTTGKMEASYEKLLEVYVEQIEALYEADVDLLVAETMLGVNETMAILDAAQTVGDLPIMCSMTIESDGSLFFGGSVLDAVSVFEEMGAAAVGINCSVGPDQLESVVSNIRKKVQIPILVKPNAGMPVISETGEAVYSMRPDEFAKYMEVLIDRGANIVGGCCGTNPEYIKELSKLIRK